MPEGVQRDLGHTRLATQGVEDPPEVARMHRRADAGGEDQAQVAPATPARPALHLLPLAMLLEKIERGRVKGNEAAAALGLRRPEGSTRAYLPLHAAGVSRTKRRRPKPVSTTPSIAATLAMRMMGGADPRDQHDGVQGEDE